MKISRIQIPPASPFPNNPLLPLTIYQGIFNGEDCRPEDFEILFDSRSWGGLWRNGVYSFHHYHSTAHEVLGCYSGGATILFGGPGGQEVSFSAGDAVFVPAGVAHCLKEAQGGLAVVGGYPKGYRPDLCEGDIRNFEKHLDRIKKLPPPAEFPAAEV